MRPGQIIFLTHMSHFGAIFSDLTLTHYRNEVHSNEKKLDFDFVSQKCCAISPIIMVRFEIFINWHTQEIKLVRQGGSESISNICPSACPFIHLRRDDGLYLKHCAEVVLNVALTNPDRQTNRQTYAR